MRSGIEVASKRQSLNPDQEFLDLWFETHPEFADSRVYELLAQGSVESLREFVEEVSKITSVVGVLNLGGARIEYIPTTSE